MEDPKHSNIEVSGPGAIASSGGIAAGQNGIAIGGNVLGNVINAATVINIIGGLENRSNLQDLGEEILATFKTGVTEPSEILQLICAPLQKQLGDRTTESILEYLQVIGFLFAPLVAKYNPSTERNIFPFGDFLQDMLTLLGKNKILTAQLSAGYGEEHLAITCRDFRLFFSTPSRYVLIPLPETEKIVMGEFSLSFPHKAPLYLFYQMAIWSGNDLFLGQFYEIKSTKVICPIQFRSREIVAYEWLHKIDHHLFTTLTSALLADLVLYLHKMNLEKLVVKNILSALSGYCGDQQ